MAGLRLGQIDIQKLHQACSLALEYLAKNPEQHLVVLVLAFHESSAAGTAVGPMAELLA